MQRSFCLAWVSALALVKYSFPNILFKSDDLKHLKDYLTSCCSYGFKCFGWESIYYYKSFLGVFLFALDLRKLQCVQNSLTRIVTNTTKYSHITPVRKAPRWLTIEHHSIFKTVLLVYKFLHSDYPKYFVLSVYKTCKS